MKISSPKNSAKTQNDVKKTDKASQTSQPPQAVKLPNLFGKKPLEYIVPLYSSLLVLILLVIFVVPGLVSPGTHFKIVSQPNKSAIYLNDVFYGTSPLEVFVPAGSYKLTLIYGDHGKTEKNIESAWTIFASLFGWFRHEVFVPIDISSSKQAILSEALSEAGIWALDPQHDQIYQAPPALYDATHTVLFAISKERPQTSETRVAPITRDLAQSFSLAALASSTSRQQLRDAARASFLMASASPSPSPLSLANSLRSLAENAKDILVSDGNLLDLELQKLFGAYQDSNGNPSRPAYQPVTLGNQRVVSGITFVEFGSGTQKYFVMRDELNRKSYQRFIDDNPAWKPENADSLKKENLVTNDYLGDLPLSGPQGFGQSNQQSSNQNAPVSGVSFYAAQAYIAWFNKTQVDPSLKALGYKASLPSAEQWLRARKAVEQSGRLGSAWFAKDAQRTQSEFSTNKNGLLNDMDGSLWEWTLSPYTPGLSLNGKQEQTITAFDYQLYQIVGGSWINRANEVIIDAPAGMLASSTFPYLGFRLALVLSTEE